VFPNYDTVLQWNIDRPRTVRITRGRWSEPFDRKKEKVLIVAIVILALIALAIYWLTRTSEAKRTGGTSLRRTASSHINANGRPKRGYATLDAAQDAARKQSASTKESMSAYKCATCKLFHIGHA
jgi:hypothetical protein